MAQPHDPHSRRDSVSRNFQPRREPASPRHLPKRADSPAPFKIGRVTCYPRGQVWYLRYHERGQRIQRRAGAKSEARRLAAEINAQLEFRTQSAFGFQGVNPEDVGATVVRTISQGSNSRVLIYAAYW